MSTLEIFPEAIGKYSFDYESRIKIKDLCFDIIKRNSFSKNKDSNNLYHYCNTNKENLLNLEQFKWFEEKISTFAADYIENILGYELKDGVVITDCWMNLCQNNGDQFLHNHGNSFISGTYYVNFNPDVHGKLKFQNKNMMSGMNSAPYLELTIKKNTKYNSGGAIMNYNEGDVLLWQSHLIHGYSGNNSDNRISISFNIMPKHFYNNSYSFKVVRE
jgi:uncharacterized protein (TIGR02466 family)